MDSCRFLPASSLALCLCNSISQISFSLSCHWFSSSLCCNFNSSRCLCRSRSSSFSCFLLSSSCCNLQLLILYTLAPSNANPVYPSVSSTPTPAVTSPLTVSSTLTPLHSYHLPPSQVIRVSGVKVITRRKYLTTHHGPSPLLHPHHTPP